MRFGIDSDGWLYKLDPSDGSPPLIIRPLPQAATQPRIVPWLWINHTQAANEQGSFDAAWNWWTSPASGGGEAHTVTNMDGAITQFMPFTRRADCSFKANSFTIDGRLCGALSDESQDEGWGPGKPGTRCAYSPAQLETKAQVLAATHVAYGIPLDVVPAGPFDRGIGWHRLHPEWSKYVGKACPGDARVAQQPQLRARAVELVTVQVAPPIPPYTDDEESIDMLKRYRDRRYQNIWLIPHKLHLSGEADAAYAADGVPLIEGQHDQMLDDLLHASGLTRDRLVPR